MTLKVGFRGVQPQNDSEHEEAWGYCNICIYMGYIGIMEKEMEATGIIQIITVSMGIIGYILGGIMENWKLSYYRGYIGCVCLPCPKAECPYSGARPSIEFSRSTC